MNNTAMERTPETGVSTRQTAKGVCKDVVHEDICISARVIIDPIVEIGPISTHCISRPEITPCDGKCSKNENCCSFVVRQHICVEVPIAFGATTTADPLGFVCGEPDVGSCKCSQ